MLAVNPIVAHSPDNLLFSFKSIRDQGDGVLCMHVCVCTSGSEAGWCACVFVSEEDAACLHDHTHIHVHSATQRGRGGPANASD